MECGANKTRAAFRAHSRSREPISHSRSACLPLRSRSARPPSLSKLELALSLGVPTLALSLGVIAALALALGVFGLSLGVLVRPHARPARSPKTRSQEPRAAHLRQRGSWRISRTCSASHQ